MSLFTVLAHHCYCSHCAVSPTQPGEFAELQAPAAGVVCGHYSARVNAWQCVYCGSATVRLTGLVWAFRQSVVSGFQQLAWEFSIGELSAHRWVKVWAAMRREF